MTKKSHFLSGSRTLPVILAAAVILGSLSGCTLKENAVPTWAENLYSHTIQLLNTVRDDTVEKESGQDTGLQKQENGSLLFSEGSEFVLPDDLPEYADSPYAEINDGKPFFEESMLTDVSRETYGEKDRLGRCTVAFASIGIDLMPVTERGSIGMVRPTGWKTVRYDFIDGMYLYNRCHLIGYQLTGENENDKNLITGTRYMNVEGMLPFENRIADYIRDTGCHVLYRVTPVFMDDELLARGVLLEAESVSLIAA